VRALVTAADASGNNHARQSLAPTGQSSAYAASHVGFGNRPNEKVSEKIPRGEEISARGVLATARGSTRLLATSISAAGTERYVACPVIA
jgi:hypothetical protein